MIRLLSILFLILVAGCTAEKELLDGTTSLQPTNNVLDYTGRIESSNDRSTLSFSDQGAWFSFGQPGIGDTIVAFNGPFLMTQKNGFWLARNLLEYLPNRESSGFRCIASNAYSSHLESVFENEEFEVSISLYFTSGYSAITNVSIKNISDRTKSIKPICKLDFWEESEAEVRNRGTHLGLIFRENRSGINIQALDVETKVVEDDAFYMQLEEQDLKAADSLQFSVAITSVVYGDRSLEDLSNLERGKYPSLDERISEKRGQLEGVLNETMSDFQNYNLVVEKCMLTLQNNWRIEAGELKHSGLFPSYNYKWFHGFWAWDSWKHAAALALYDSELAKNQVRAMYDYMDDTGFIPDCIYRDTTIERHNYRNTKPPLSGWAIWSIYEADHDTLFLEEMYDNLKFQHEWWYEYRDSDLDGMCEYGSTDGTLIAAKWESGMDNAVRFDSSGLNKILDNAYSLNQESVDLNAYLLAEKRFIVQIAKVLNRDEDIALYEEDYKWKTGLFQSQFFDEETGWFYDTSIDGREFIKVKGSEGWTPLWAEVATKSQAKSVKEIMLSNAFNGKVPFQTLDSNHPKFQPDNGYWRGPVWLDQTYFGVQGLKNYGYDKEANVAIRKVLDNCEGLNDAGPGIRENYQPSTGDGMEAHNFSWSAAHILLMLTER